MSIGLAQGFITVLTLLVFLGICVWAYRPGNRSRFDEDAQLEAVANFRNQLAFIKRILRMHGLAFVLRFPVQ